MATDKQKEYIKKLCVWKGRDASQINFDNLTEDEASVAIDELKALSSVKSNNEISQPKPRPKNGDKVKIGLACKLLVAENGVWACLAKKKDFVKKAKALYELMAEAEAEILASVSGD